MRARYGFSTGEGKASKVRCFEMGSSWKTGAWFSVQHWRELRSVNIAKDKFTF